MQKLKAAVIGAGWFAAYSHIPTLAARAEVELDGVCRLGVDDLERVRDAFGFAFASEDYHEVLARRPDVVIVSSPHRFHYEQARAALEGGAHVMCEKPMTLDPDEAWDLVEIARRNDRHLLIANSHNYLPHVGALRDRIADGLIGEIEHVSCSFISVTREVFTGAAGLKRWDEAFFRPDRSTWQDPQGGGGFAYGQLSHSLALMFYLSGLVPDRVAALTRVAEGVDIADSAVLGCKGGATVSVSGSVAMPQGERALMRVFLAGSLGLVTAEFDLDRCDIKLNDGTRETLPLSAGDWAVNSAAPVDALVDLALGRGRNQSEGAIGAMTTATIHAMLASADKGGEMVGVVTR
ncbi:Gfo/Idh/MocA family protein [Psychromarinibacter halotolerans]|uniref:Gfo/Idh/MocA family protein n=1 Tax=Psychromarinibacter halotolerans TaxID=1775175 RepID=A0ABV7GVE9_9RHOB|nr:Gfo/Idh/MocA family oxidoreductase [Psychromarinibacter halotolerans]MDF0595276.1 Gfo/Idh/MocA family oxidoreductase [Psychromarinibacter halotolerans]